MENDTSSPPDSGGPGSIVFISYASANRKQALSLTTAIERRGPDCWISARDVAPGENYQEAIVRALRGARAIVLVFSAAANDSDEIKKELSLASRYKIPVLALRIEDVEPSDAFAYELSTRQWIDAFEGWEKSIDALVGRIGQLTASAFPSPAPPRPRRAMRLGRHPLGMAAAAIALLAGAGAAWWLLRPSPAHAHSMIVRLTGFRLLSPDLPSRMHDTVDSEITAAFNADGVIGVSSASAPPPGDAPAYALGGTINHVGNSIRVITQFIDERSGTILWSDSVDYPAEELDRVPRLVAVDAGIVLRCGLFGASTYRKSLPDAVLKDYLQFCQHSWSYGGNKTLVPAQRVVAALPDFSWGWAAVAMGNIQVAFSSEDDRSAAEARANGLQAAARAIKLDPGNSDALTHKNLLIDPRDWVARENLLKRAIAAKPLDCGCEHYNYGLMLMSVGRLDESVEQFRQATDMLTLWPDSQFDLAESLLSDNRAEEARTHIEKAIDLNSEPDFRLSTAILEGTETGDYAAAIAALRSPRLEADDKQRAALLSAYMALASGNASAKSAAVRALLALPVEQKGRQVAQLLSALGATHEALEVAGQAASTGPYGPRIFWRRSMRAVLYDPSFAGIAQRLGLIAYWKNSATRPDICKAGNTPPFCQAI